MPDAAASGQQQRQRGVRWGASRVAWRQCRRSAGPASAARRPRNKKPRRAEPVGVDGGRTALAVGFGGGRGNVPPAWKQEIAPVGAGGAAYRATGKCPPSGGQLQLTPARATFQARSVPRPMGNFYRPAVDHQPAENARPHAKGRFQPTDGQPTPTRPQTAQTLARALLSADQAGIHISFQSIK